MCLYLTAEYNVLTKLTGFALTRGMLCAMKRNVLPSVEDICKHANRIAILEDVVNPTNVGALSVLLLPLAWTLYFSPMLR